MLRSPHLHLRFRVAMLIVAALFACGATADEPKKFEGNQPQVVKPAADGSLRLHAKTCEVYGPTLQYMTKEQALGWWNSSADRAVWMLEAPTAGSYTVWFDLSCPDESAGESYVLSCGDQEFHGAISSTGNWQNYRFREMGHVVRVGPGVTTLTIQCEDDPNVALADLREVRLRPVANTSAAQPVGPANGGRLPFKTLLIDGQNNHDWQTTSPILRDILADTGQFMVDILSTPAAGDDMRVFRPAFARQQVVVLNYNGQPWPEKAQQELVKYVRGGGGLVIVHAANNAFPDWPEYNEMIGLGWRGAEFGRRVTVDNAGQAVQAAAGEGPGAGHGAQHEFAVVSRDRNHPITRGLPSSWLHSKDELYHGQRGPAVGMHILATAFSDTAHGGTGAHEPMAWVIPYGKGRVFTMLLGHADYSMKCAGFQTLLVRGAEWAASGDVLSQDPPRDFPTVMAPSVRP